MKTAETPRQRITLFQLAVPFCAVIAFLGIVYPKQFAATIQDITGSAFATLDWFFMLSVTGFLILCIVLALSPYGKLKLGKPEDEPDFSTVSWLAMLFAAGMGVGLLFWGVAEPLTHYASPPVGTAKSPVAARQALVITNFHWGLHAWAVYCIGALVLAYFRYRRGEPYLAGSPIRSAFRGKWVGPVAGLADLIAVLAVTFGVAGSLAMGVFQLHVGLHVATGFVPLNSDWMAIGLLVLLFFSYMGSAATSLAKGIQYLSNINMALAMLLMLFVLLTGPTPFLLRGFVTTIGDYTSSLGGMTLRLYPYRQLSSWFGSWTLIYFLWWIAWAPFVGIFIARISKGRTIREFVIGVLFVPTVFSLFWFAIFGGMGIYEETYGEGGLADLVKEDVTVALFSLFDTLPMSALLSTVAVILIYIFVVTSVDSATFVLGMLTSKGSMNPPTSQKLTWGIILAGLGGALVLSKNIEVVRAGAISFAIPLTLILHLQVAGLLRVLRSDVDVVGQKGIQKSVENTPPDKQQSNPPSGENPETPSSQQDGQPNPEGGQS
ncbi:MAG: BCCT family transporter [Gemmataceae bacterium]